MTIQEKAKAYDKVVEKLRSLHDNYDTVSTLIDIKEELENIFPELKESEGDKTKRMLDIITYKMSQHQPDIFTGEENEWFNTWLEKQGEQKYWDSVKPVSEEDKLYLMPDEQKSLDDMAKEVIKDKDAAISFLKSCGIMNENGELADEYKIDEDIVEPKFHEGDWIVTNQGKVNQVVSIDKDVDGYTLDDGGYFSGSWCGMYHLWTIQDAKDGDVIVNGSNIFIFHFINDTRLMGYCHVNTDDGRFYDDIGKNECFCLIDAIVHPATKEQRDLLFQKMKEAGYEWGAEKKELKKIEQNPAWSEDDEDIINKILCICDDFKRSFEISPASTKVVQNDIDKIDSWLKSLKERYTWKPSDEQIKLLREVQQALLGKDCHNRFVNFMYELKRLREE